MKQPYILILTFFGVTLLTMGFQCGKDYPEPIPVYEFSEKLALTPYKKTYAVGDTIWVQFQVADKTFFDKLSGNRIAVDTTVLSGDFYFSREYPTRDEVSLYGDTKIESALGVSFGTPNAYATTFKTDCGSGPYFFRIGFTPRKTGVFAISQRGDVSRCPDKTSFTPSTFQFTFDLADCNKDVWLSIPPASRSGQLGRTDVAIDKKEMFVFKVE